jgi:hypothetical protein
LVAAFWPAGGCQPVPAGASGKLDEKHPDEECPFELLDTYLSYLGGLEKERFWAVVRTYGFARTLRCLKYPETVWANPCRAWGVHTPRGAVAWEDLPQFLNEAMSVTDRLRILAGGSPGLLIPDVEGDEDVSVEEMMRILKAEQAETVREKIEDRLEELRRLRAARGGMNM